MFGIILTSIYAAFLCVTGHQGPEIMVKASSFLFYWFAIFATCRMIFTLVVSCFIPLLTGVAAGAAGAQTGSGPAAVLAALGGASLGAIGSVMWFFGSVLNAILKVGGAYLLSTSVTGVGAMAVWNNTRLFIGGILLLVGLLTSGSSSSSNSSNKKDK